MTKVKLSSKHVTALRFFSFTSESFIFILRAVPHFHDRIENLYHKPENELRINSKSDLSLRLHRDPGAGPWQIPGR